MPMQDFKMLLKIIINFYAQNLIFYLIIFQKNEDDI